MRRFLSFVFVMIGISLMTFVLIRYTNGNPVRMILGNYTDQAPPETIRYVEEQLGIDKPIHIQYITWIKKLIRLDLGESFTSRRPVLEELTQRFPLTFLLAATSVILALLIAFPIGILMAYYPESLFCRFFHALAMFFVSTSSFLIALGLIYIFSVKLNWVPVVSTKEKNNYILVILSYAAPLASTYLIMIESGVQKVIDQDYIVTAKVKGLRRPKIVSRHIVKNSLLPILPLVGMNLSSLLGGSFIIESIFSVPGIGKYAVDSIFANDYPVIQAYVVFLALIIVLINFAVDILYTIVDPRMKVE